MKQWVNLNFLPTLLAQVGSQGSDQGNGRNQSSDAVNDNIQGDVRNVIIHGMVAAMEPATIRKAIQKAGTLTDEAIRNGSLMKNTEKRGNGGESNRHRNVKDDNKRSRTGNAFTTTTNPVKRVYMGMAAKYTN
ncbi:hypothetical protein Tco_1234046, partial [Tanacetum coccineum]